MPKRQITFVFLWNEMGAYQSLWDYLSEWAPEYTFTHDKMTPVLDRSYCLQENWQILCPETASDTDIAIKAAELTDYVNTEINSWKAAAIKDLLLPS